MKPDVNTVLATFQKAIKRVDRPENRVNTQQFFKEQLEHPMTLKATVLRKISNEQFKTLKGVPGQDILKLCDALLKTGERYTCFLAFDWASKVHREYEPKNLALFERWLKVYVDNWGRCDSLCGVTGLLIHQYPELAPKLEKWTRSKNRWFKRAAAVSLIVPALKGQLLDRVFWTADTLMMDEDDMVQKGYGWMLKEASKTFNAEVFAYVLKHKDRMPRTALRYAIEKYPPEMRKEAMGG